jgi:phospholipid/cholesterol/gamma-HCH transport system permease protein
MAWQAIYQFTGLAPMQMVGGQTAKVVVMEAGPILAGLVLAGRCGAALAAELGLMAVSRQVEALRVQNLSPVQLLSFPRVVALVVASPALSVFTNLAGLVGAYLVVAYQTGVTLPEFLTAAQESLRPIEIWAGMIKSAVFGYLIGTIGCYFGLQTQDGSVGLARQTIRAFVWAAVAVLLADYLLWSILF